MTIKEAQELVDAWGDKHAIRHNELANMALLTEEIGKLARVMVRRYGEHAADRGYSVGSDRRGQPDGRRSDRRADPRAGAQERGVGGSLGPEGVISGERCEVVAAFLPILVRIGRIVACSGE